MAAIEDVMMTRLTFGLYAVKGGKGVVNRMTRERVADTHPFLKMLSRIPVVPWIAGSINSLGSLVLN